MIIDSELEICDAEDVTAVAGTEYSNVGFGNIIDLGALDFGPEVEFWVRCAVTTAFTSAGAATVQFSLVTNSVSPISGGTPVVLYASAAIPKATLVAGYQVFYVPVDPLLLQRYLGMSITTAVATTTAGAIDCYLVRKPEVRD